MCFQTPRLSTKEYAEGHDANMFRCLLRILEVADDTIQPLWKTISTLPFHAGGMGLRSMKRIRSAAYWASWADCFKMIQDRNPHVASVAVNVLERNGFHDVRCMRELEECTHILERESFTPKHKLI